MPRWQDPPAATGTLPRGEGTSAAFEPTPSALPDEPPLPAEELCGLDRGAGYKGLGICGNSTIGGSTAVGENTAIASHISIGDYTTIVGHANVAGDLSVGTPRREHDVARARPFPRVLSALEQLTPIAVDSIDDVAWTRWR